MGLIRDREEELSELQRMVLRAQDPARRASLTAPEWQVAIIGYALQLCEEPDFPTADSLAVYAAFAACVPEKERALVLVRMGQFITVRRGAGWRALLLFVQGEAAARLELCSRAAGMALTLAQPTEDTRFAGAAALVDMVMQGQAPAAALSAILGVADQRMLPLLQPLLTLPPERMEALLAGLRCRLNSLSAEWLLRVLESAPSLGQAVTDALARAAAGVDTVEDVVYPIPVWDYADPKPQALHGWTRAEYLPRLRARLLPHLTPEQWAALEGVFA